MLFLYLCLCVCVRVCVRMFSSSLNRKQARRRDEKLLPPLLSPLSDEPPRKRTCDASLSEEGGAVGMLPSSVSSTSTSSSSHRHRRGEGKASSHARNGTVSVYYGSIFISMSRIIVVKMILSLLFL